MSGAARNRSVATKHTPEVPSERKQSPGSTTPSPTAAAALSPPPAATGTSPIPQRAARAGRSVPVASGLAPGSRVRIAIRPEKIRFVGESDEGAIPGTVEGARYLGDVTHWHVRLDDETTWTVFARDDGGAGQVAPGRRVGLAWAPEHGVLLER